MFRFGDEASEARTAEPYQIPKPMAYLRAISIAREAAVLLKKDWIYVDPQSIVDPTKEKLR